MILAAPLPLTCHPATPDSAVRQVSVAVALTAAGLALRYTVEATALLIPCRTDETAQPTDGLWRHTCCEVFVRRDDRSAYREFNFSPSGQWAAYAFSDTRQRDPAGEAAWRVRPAIDCIDTAGGFELQALLPASQLPVGPGRPRIGLSVVLETSTAGTAPVCSYWALHHPAAQPDFHHRAAFVLTLD